MESRAPAVVAVVVGAEPDGRIEAAVASLAAQDYADLSILVLVANTERAVLAERIAGIAPGAFVAELVEDRGFGAAINRSLEMVEGATFLLVCHDDVVLDPDAVHLMVEESFRSNAGIVTPKVVSMRDRSVLLHVGQGVDRFGTIVEKVQTDEIDQGQHDAVRDVFVAPGGATLIRADLLRSIGGYDERYLAMGDDLEMCWRARLAGARIVCAPQAVVAHEERLASQEHPLLTPEGEAQPPSLSRLYRRNEVRTLLICWGLVERILTLSLLVPLHLGEIIVAAIGGDHDRAVDIREAWRSAFRERKAIRSSRQRTRALRTMSDRDVRSLQVRGATRLRAFAVALLHQGFDSARGVLPHEQIIVSDDEAPELTASFGGAFSDDEGFDELDDLGRRGHRHTGRRRLSSVRSLTTLTIAALVLYLVGSRNLIGARLPMIGRLVDPGSWTHTWHMVFASWQPAGMGSGAPGHPGFMALGLLGTFTFGQMGAAVRLLLLGSIPVGAVGISRLLRPVASGRSRLLAAAAFGGLALGVNAIASGDLGAVVALGAMPFLLRRILRLCRVAPFDEPFASPVPLASRGWRSTLVGQIAGFSLLLTVTSAVAPATLVVVALSSLGIAVIGVIAEPKRAAAGQAKVWLGIAIAVILLAPLSLSAVLSGPSGLSVFGGAPGPWSTPGLGGLLRFAAGPSGHGFFAWFLPVAALVPLLVARQARLTLAVRLAGAAVVSLALGLVVARGGLADFAPDLLVCLAPVATAVAALAGLGLAAFESDLPKVDFGWRQVIALGGVTLALVGIIPIILDAGGGRWRMPSTGYSDSLRFLDGRNSLGHRILWVGDPRTIPGGSWSIEPGLAWSTSTDGLPDSSTLFAPASAVEGAAVTSALGQAMRGETIHLGQLLSPASIEAIVVTRATVPSAPGSQAGQAIAPPVGLIPSLEHQLDLIQTPSGGGVTVFEIGGSMPIVGTRPEPLSRRATTSSVSAVAGWSGLSTAEDGGSWPTGGTAPEGARSLYVGIAPAGDVKVVAGREPVAGRPAFGWASTFPVTPGQVAVSLDALPLNGLLAAAALSGWLGIMLCLVGRHRWLDWWWPAARRRHARLSIDPVDDDAGSDSGDLLVETSEGPFGDKAGEPAP
ncbi:MAG: glycosyltransferase family 2 protein [Actinomycetes bacterium]